MPDVLSATVLLRPAGGRSVADVATAETAEQLLPDPAAAERAREFFRRAGFEIAAAFGPSFSIVGPTELFERTFGTRLELRDGTDVQTTEGRRELPLTSLPPDVQHSLEAVTFTPPPDFGPTKYA
jgi:hypothetical protein